MTTHHAIIDRDDDEIRLFATEGLRDHNYDNVLENGFGNWERVTVTIEKVKDPLPTTPGSVVQSVYQGFLVLDNNGHWGNANHHIYPGDEELIEDWSVMFDKGASK